MKGGCFLINTIFIKIKKEYHILIIFFITLILAIPLIYGEFVLLDDASFHAERIYDLANSIRQGDFRPYIYSNTLNGYGYANPIFYPDLFLYIPAIVNMLGVKLSTCYKLYILFSSFFTGIISYYCLKRITNNNKLSLIFSCTYMVFPYRIYDLYYRNAIGEVLFFLFFPVIVLGLHDIFNNNKWKVLAIGCTCMCYSHLLSFFMVVIFIGVIYIFNIRKLTKKIILNTIKAILLSFLLCINLLLPILEFLNWDTYLVNITNPFGSLSSNAIIVSDIFNKNIYRPFIVFSFICIILLIINKYLKNDSPILSMLFIGIVCLIICTNLFPWDLLSMLFPFVDKIQFPWRVNCFATFFISMFLSLVFLKVSELLQAKNLKISLMFLHVIPISLLIIFMGITFFIYTNTDNKYNTDYIPSSIGRGEYLPERFMGLFNADYEHIQDLGFKVKQRDVIINGIKDNVASISIEKNKTVIFLKNIDRDKNKVELPFTYYKGYEVYLNGNKINNEKSTNGLIEINIENMSDCTLEVMYKGTITQKISLYISLITFILSITFEIKIKKK